MRLPHCRLCIFILQIDLESMLETMSTKLPLIYIPHRKFTHNGNLGDSNLVDKNVLIRLLQQFDISIINNECLSSIVIKLLFHGIYRMLIHVNQCLSQDLDFSQKRSYLIFLESYLQKRGVIHSQRKLRDEARKLRERVRSLYILHAQNTKIVAS